jgi:4-hydroxyacetophenone monooxygenase
MSNKNFVIFDMNPEIGGTWYSNSYLGSGSDAPTHLYALSSEPKFGNTLEF